MTTNIPHLTTALTGPLLALEEAFFKHQSQIEAWFRCQWRSHRPPIYGSVDLRNAGFKVGPVDTNLFPAGFNNLNPEFFPLAIQAAQATLQQYYPDCQRILIIAEDHTRNLFYLKSVSTLQTILHQAGYDVEIGSLNPDITQPLTLDIDADTKITLNPIQRQDDTLQLQSGFTPCLIWLNNDLSNAVPDILKDLKQTIAPPMRLGWANRLKSEHFQHYADVCDEFSKLVDVDPWLLQPLFSQCGAVDFQQREGEECLVEKVDQLVADIQQKYDAHKIESNPFVVVKADAGTYGMGILMVENGDAIRSLNRKQRKQMTQTKGQSKITKVIIQEGIPSFET